MSNYVEAVQYILKWEDPEGTFIPCPDACPKGCTGPCFAIAGINSGAFPMAYSSILAAPQPSCSALVQAFYEAQFWKPMQIGLLDSQDLANRVLDMGVNGGSRISIGLLQQAANSISHESPLVIDGFLGPNTANMVNSLEEHSILAAFRSERVARYQNLVKENPSLQRYYAGWMKRATA